jgi:hypothetical protein
MLKTAEKRCGVTRKKSRNKEGKEEREAKKAKETEKVLTN